ncbi:MAG: bacillithiol biosynthesis deacetylase BshB1 [Candidatus Hydrogenedentes bacterium]|nr:bacillithiol biosynthesis deacetylase BshB1 [Candidatus Hydrogenedentota bacterium]
MSVDVLAIGAHPDDVDIGVGGTLLRLIDRGHSVAILDLTRGEAGSRGTVEERLQEARDAATTLGVTTRENAALPDGGLTNSVEQREPIIRCIRTLRPKVILSHLDKDRHPDHRVAHDLVRDANFYAGVASIDTGAGPYRAPQRYGYRPYHEDDTRPQFIVDISNYFEEKMRVLKSFRSQLYNPSYDGPETLIASEEFWDAIRTRAAYWGHRAQVAYGEPLFSDVPIVLNDLPGLGDES